jgi:YVTN family beta-propeller protein
VRELPSGTVTFLFTDIEGSTALVRRLRDRYPEVLADHTRILRDAVAEAGGSEIDTQGDSFFFVFARARDAVVAAANGQRALASHAWPEGGVVRVRMGVHTGEGTAVDGRYHGVAVHRAARIHAVGHGGQVLVSQTTHNLLEDEEELPFDLRDLGPQRLKDFDQPVRVYQLAIPGLPQQFPPLRTRVAIEGPAPRSWVARRRWLLVGGAVAVGALATTLAVVLTQAGSSQPALVPANSVAAIDPRTDRVDSRVAVGNQSVAGAGSIPVGTTIAIGSGSVWVANPNDQTISRIDPRTGAVSEIGGIGGEITSLAADRGGIWGTVRDKGLVHVDPGTNSVEQISLLEEGGFHPSYDGVVARSGELFLGRTDLGALSLAKFSPRTRALRGSAHIGQAGDHGLVDGLGAIWISDRADNTVSEVVPRSMKVAGTAAVVDPGAVTAGDGKVWVTDEIHGQLWYLVPERLNLVQPPVAVGNRPAGVAFGYGFVWVANYGDGTVSKVDPTTKRVIKRIKVGAHVSSIAAGAGKVWVSVPPPAGVS